MAIPVLVEGALDERSGTALVPRALHTVGTVGTAGTAGTAGRIAVPGLLPSPGRVPVERLLPVLPELEALFPGGGLSRGTTVVVGPSAPPGATSLALSLLAGASSAGHWCAVAGLPELGVVAASELGVDLARLVLVPFPGPEGRWQGVVATLLETVDFVCLVPGAPVRPPDARRLAARARERGAVLVVLDGERRPAPGLSHPRTRTGSAERWPAQRWPAQRWPGPADLRCTVAASGWEGLGSGHGLLASRRLEAEISGRGAASRPRRGLLELPA